MTVAVKTIEHKKRSVELVTENGCCIKARKVIYATGYEVVQYIDKPIVKLQSTYATISEPLSLERPFWKNDMLLWNTASPYLYMRTTKDNRIVVGGRDEDFYLPGKRDELITLKTKKLTNDFHKTFPHINFIQNSAGQVHLVLLKMACRLLVRIRNLLMVTLHWVSEAMVLLSV